MKYNIYFYLDADIYIHFLTHTIYTYKKVFICILNLKVYSSEEQLLSTFICKLSASL